MRINDQLMVMTLPSTSTRTGGRKHSAVVCSPRGEMLLVWAEQTGWQRGGDSAGWSSIRRACLQKYEAESREMCRYGDWQPQCGFRRVVLDHPLRPIAVPFALLVSTDFSRALIWGPTSPACEDSEGSASRAILDLNRTTSGRPSLA